MALLESSVRKKDQIECEKEKQEVLDAMQRTRLELKQAHESFNDAKEPELVEATVFEINALQARYAYYLRLAKEMGCEEPKGEAFRKKRRFIKDRE